MTNEERLIDLEIRITRQDDLVDTLNTQVYRQQEKLLELEALCVALANRMREFAASASERAAAIALVVPELTFVALPGAADVNPVAFALSIAIVAFIMIAPGHGHLAAALEEAPVECPLVGIRVLAICRPLRDPRPFGKPTHTWA